MIMILRKKAQENWVALTLAGLVGVVGIVFAVLFPPAAPFVLGAFALGGLAVSLYAAITYFTSGSGGPAATTSAPAAVNDLDSPVEPKSALGQTVVSTRSGPSPLLPPPLAEEVTTSGPAAVNDLDSPVAPKSARGKAAAHTPSLVGLFNTGSQSSGPSLHERNVGACHY